MIRDIRYNYTNIVDFDQSKWSRDWYKFVGLPYIPLISELEEMLIPYNDPIIYWMQQKWHYSIYFVIIYLLLIRILKNWVKLRGKPYDLRRPMIVWNASMAVFSTLGVIRCLPQFIQILTSKGLTASYCQADFFHDARLVLWYTLFDLSKLPELIDTLFIVLRGGKLIYLHWVHHALTLMFCWYTHGSVPATAQWMVNMNNLAHSLMYTHYALSSMQFAVPVLIRISITTIQTIQMAFGIYFHTAIISRRLFTPEQPCDCSFNNAVVGLSMYLLYLILFGNYFIRTYVLREKKVKPN